jgi:hypothetical protein
MNTAWEFGLKSESLGNPAFGDVEEHYSILRAADVADLTGDGVAEARTQGKITP